jgi:hypothetical protein
MKKVKVNPKKDENGVPMMAFDTVGRVLPYREGGTLVTCTTRISRQIKSGDLIIVKEVNPVTVKPKKTSTKKTNKKESEVSL